MTGWTEAERDALFLPPSQERAGEGAVASAFDGSDEEMRRLRFPFEATRAGDAEQDQEVPLDDE